MNSEEDNGWYKNGKSSNKMWQNTANKQIRGKPCMDVQKTVGYCAYSTECKLHLGSQESKESFPPPKIIMVKHNSNQTNY